MHTSDFEYTSLISLLEEMPDDGRSNSLKFLKWFLLKIVGLDENAADDALCDGGNDKGIDGLFVDKDNEQVIFLQSKLKQNTTKQIGDKEIREFAGSIELFNTPEKIEKLLEGSPNADLERLLIDNNVAHLVSNGFAVKGYFLTNSTANSHANESATVNGIIAIYDNEELSRKFIDPITGGGVAGSKTFSYDANPLVYKANKDLVQLTFMAKSTELINLDGVSDNTLFDINVRYPLGNTKVNKGIKKSVEESSEHSLFALFHNGIVILCDDLKVDEKASEITIENYAVVNGAQSIKQLHLNAPNLSDDLHVLTRIINANVRSELAGKITERTNTQNGVRPRDKRSNDLIQTRLAGEMESLGIGYSYEIKRGSESKNEIITNEQAGKFLLTFDLLECFSTHQLSKIFESKYHEIFARPIVDAARIVGIRVIYDEIEKACTDLSNKGFGTYAQTKYLLLQTLSLIFRRESDTYNLFRDLSKFVVDGKSDFIAYTASELLDELIVDLNHEEQHELKDFNFKSDLKNRAFCEKLIGSLMRDRIKSVRKGKSKTISELYDDKYSSTKS